MIKMNKKVLSGSEALYGFCGWLTTREKRTVMSNTDECGGIADLIKIFCETNNLPGPRGEWTDYLTHPEEK